MDEIANKLSYAVAFFLCLSSLVSCSHYHKSDNYPKSSGVRTLSIDATQRIIFFTDLHGNNVTCSEPSPDALSVLSASFGGGLQYNEKASANIATAITQSAASIGLRTQSIQLLRDGMYRTCEAYAAGAIDEHEYNRQLRRYQNLMLSLLAIEQITGATVAKQVGLGAGSSNANVGANADDAAKEVALTEKEHSDAKAKLKELEDQKSKDVAACDKNPGTPPVVSDECNKKESSTKLAEEQKVVVATAENKQRTANLKLQAVRSAVTAAASGAKIDFGSGPQHSLPTSEKAVLYVAEAARTIVSTTLLASFAQEECSRLWDFIEPRSMLKLNDFLKIISVETDNQVFNSLGNDVEFKRAYEAGVPSDIYREISSFAKNKNINLDKVNQDKISKMLLPRATSKFEEATKNMNANDKSDLLKSLIKGCGQVLENLKLPVMYTPMYKVGDQK